MLCKSLRGGVPLVHWDSETLILAIYMYASIFHVFTSYQYYSSSRSSSFATIVLSFPKPLVSLNPKWSSLYQNVLACQNLLALQATYSTFIHWTMIIWFFRVVLKLNLYPIPRKVYYWARTRWKALFQTVSEEQHMQSRPFYSLVSDLVFEWQQGWRWPFFNTDLAAFVV